MLETAGGNGNRTRAGWLTATCAATTPFPRLEIIKVSSDRNLQKKIVCGEKKKWVRLNRTHLDRQPPGTTFYQVHEFGLRT